MAEEAGGAGGGAGAAAGGAAAEEAEGAGAPLQRHHLPAAEPPAGRAPGGLRHQGWVLLTPTPTRCPATNSCSRLSGLQASSSGQVRADHAPTSKRHRLEQIKEPHTKRRKMATCWWVYGRQAGRQTDRFLTHGPLTFTKTNQSD